MASDLSPAPNADEPRLSSEPQSGQPDAGNPPPKLRPTEQDASFRSARLVGVGACLLLLGAVSISLLKPNQAPELTIAGAASEAPTPSISPSILAQLGLPPEIGSTDAGVDEPPETEELDPLLAYSGWTTFPDGGSVPALPLSAPHAIRFGAALFPYQGAEFASANAPNREQALELARAAISVAETDFKKAVQLGRGGGVDLGLMHRGVLEPPIEYLLFTLKQGAVHPEPIDTPRGYWVVKRTR